MQRFIQIYERCYHDDACDIAMQFAFRSDSYSEKSRSAPNTPARENACAMSLPPTLDPEVKEDKSKKNINISYKLSP